MVEILNQIETVILSENVLEIIIVIGANSCNPKELWRFKIGNFEKQTNLTSNKLKVRSSVNPGRYTVQQKSQTKNGNDKSDSNNLHIFRLPVFHILWRLTI